MLTRTTLGVIPAKAGIQAFLALSVLTWIPAFAGMTPKGCVAAMDLKV